MKHKTSARITSCITLAAALTIAIASVVPLPAAAGRRSSPRSDCMRSLMYPNGIRDYKISVETAGRSCRNVNTRRSSRAVTSCTRSLMYPNGIRDRRVSLETASNACRNATTPRSSRRVTNCTRSLMYPNGIRNYRITEETAARACQAPARRRIIRIR